MRAFSRVKFGKLWRLTLGVVLVAGVARCIADRPTATASVMQGTAPDSGDLTDATPTPTPLLATGGPTVRLEPCQQLLQHVDQPSFLSHLDAFFLAQDRGHIVALVPDANGVDRIISTQAEITPEALFVPRAISPSGHTYTVSFSSLVNGNLITSGADGRLHESVPNVGEASWHFQPADANTFLLVFESTGLCLTLENGSQKLLVLPYKKGLGSHENAWQTLLKDFKPWWYYNFSATPPAQIDNKYAFIPMLQDVGGDANAFLMQVRALSRSSISQTYYLGFGPQDTNDLLGGQFHQQSIAASWYPVAAATEDLNSAWVEAFCTDMFRSSVEVYPQVALPWSGSADIASLQAFLDQAHTTYPLADLWLTDFAPCETAQPSSAQSLKFMTDALTLLDNTPYVRRYAWSDVPADDSNCGAWALRNADGTLTALGQTYGAYPWPP